MISLFHKSNKVLMMIHYALLTLHVWIAVLWLRVWGNECMLNTEMKSLFIYMSRCTPFSTNVCFGLSS